MLRDNVQDIDLRGCLDHSRTKKIVLTARAGGHLVGRQNFEAMPKYCLAVQFLRPRVGKTLAADSLANILACQLLAGRARAGSKQPLRAKTGGTG